MKNSKKSHIFIFNVERGLSVFIRTGLNQGILYDCGSSEDFSPLDFVKENILPHLDVYSYRDLGDEKIPVKIAQAIISHPHGDHISEIDKLSSEKDFYCSFITCPHDKDGSKESEKINWEKITNKDEEQIANYKKMYDGRKLPLQTIKYTSQNYIPNLEYGIFYLRPPVIESEIHNSEQEYTNCTSIVFYFKHGKNTLLVPGDMTPQGFKHLLEEKEGFEKRYTIFESSSENPKWNEETLDQPSLKSLLENGLSVLVAPHHGLESGFSEDLYNNMGSEQKPSLVVISEKRHTGENDGTVDSRYQGKEGSLGRTVYVDGEAEDRNSISTINGHHILISFEGSSVGFDVFAEKDPKKLLEKIS